MARRKKPDVQAPVTDEELRDMWDRVDALARVNMPEYVSRLGFPREAGRLADQPRLDLESGTLLRGREVSRDARTSMFLAAAERSHALSVSASCDELQRLRERKAVERHGARAARAAMAVALALDVIPGLASMVERADRERARPLLVSTLRAIAVELAGHESRKRTDDQTNATHVPDRVTYTERHICERGFTPLPTGSLDASMCFRPVPERHARCFTPGHVGPQPGEDLMKRYQILQSADRTESSLFPVDHPQRALLSIDSDGRSMHIVEEFEAASDDVARARYRGWLDRPGRFS